MENVKMPFGELESGYFLYRGKLYFAGQWGKATVYFPVKDGIVLNCSDNTNIYPREEIEVIHADNFHKYGLPAKFEKK